MLWKSRDLASFTASELDRELLIFKPDFSSFSHWTVYENVFLELVASIETEQDLKDAQAELKNFSVILRCCFQHVLYAD